MTMEKILSRRDLAFLLYEWLDVEALTRRSRYAEHSRETFDAALDTAENIATDLFAPHARKSDLNEPQFDGERVHLIPEIGRALDAFVAAGLMAAEHDEALGGMQLPDHRQRQPAAGTRVAGTDRRFRPARACRALLRDHVPVGTAGGLIAVRHHDPR